MNAFQRFLTPGEPDPRVNVSIITPKAAIITTVVLIVYSGLLLKIYDRIGASADNGAELAAAILALIFFASVSIALGSNYAHFITYTRPLLIIARGAREVSEGNYNIHLPLHRKDGKTDEIDALIQDFNTMVEDLHSTEMLKSSFISNISHELKTPISVISNYVTILSEDSLSDTERQEYLAKIRTASKDLSELIANILQITKLDNDQIKANYSSFDLSEELIQCILGYELLLDEKDIDLDLDIPENLEIESDQGLIKIVFNNIFSNALKFTPAKGSIKVSLKQDAATSIVTITDSGCGMDKNTLKHIFEKFYQGDTSHATKGNGLGLAMVRQIVDLLGGNIDVDSTPGTGSTFKISFPNHKS